MIAFREPTQVRLGARMSPADPLYYQVAERLEVAISNVAQLVLSEMGYAGACDDRAANCLHLLRPAVLQRLGYGATSRGRDDQRGLATEVTSVAFGIPIGTEVSWPQLDVLALATRTADSAGIYPYSGHPNAEVIAYFEPGGAFGRTVAEYEIDVADIIDVPVTDDGKTVEQLTAELEAAWTACADDEEAAGNWVAYRAGREPSAGTLALLLEAQDTYGVPPDRPQSTMRAGGTRYAWEPIVPAMFAPCYAAVRDAADALGISFVPPIRYMPGDLPEDLPGGTPRGYPVRMAKPAPNPWFVVSVAVAAGLVLRKLFG